jgi:hypothetical protein
MPISLSKSVEQRIKALDANRQAVNFLNKKKGSVRFVENPADTPNTDGITQTALFIVEGLRSSRRMGATLFKKLQGAALVVQRSLTDESYSFHAFPNDGHFVAPRITLKQAKGMFPVDLYQQTLRAIRQHRAHRVEHIMGQKSVRPRRFGGRK